MDSKMHYKEFSSEFEIKEARSTREQIYTLTPSSRGGGLGTGPGRYSGAFAGDWLLRDLCAGRLLLGRGAVPIVHHLRGEDQVERETGDKAVENKLVLDLLECGEDAR